MEENREIIFVYGTLRSGGSNHHRLRGATPLGPGTLRGRLFRIAWYPGVVLDARAGEVCGELHAVEPAMLAALDEYEGGEYRRVRTTVAREPDAAAIDAWIWEYRMPVDALAAIPHGDWLAPGDA